MRLVPFFHAFLGIELEIRVCFAKVVRSHHVQPGRPGHILVQYELFVTRAEIFLSQRFC